jgi:hypothetical protein
MDVDLSSKEMKAASTAFAVAAEIAKERLGQGDCVKPEMLLQGLTDDQLREFIRICRELEHFCDQSMNEQAMIRKVIESGGAIKAEQIPPDMARSIRERKGGYGE